MTLDTGDTTPLNLLFKYLFSEKRELLHFQAIFQELLPVKECRV